MFGLTSDIINKLKECNDYLKKNHLTYNEIKNILKENKEEVNLSDDNFWKQFLSPIDKPLTKEEYQELINKENSLENLGIEIFELPKKQTYFNY